MASQWFVAHTYGGQEFNANVNLSRQGYEVFVPVHLQPIRRQQPRYRPLFQNYVFILFDVKRDIWTPVMHTYGIRRLLVNAPGEPAPISDSFINGLKRQTVASDDPKRPVIYEGCMVRVKRGIMINQVGLCSSTDGDRVKLMLEAMGHDVEFEFDVGDLQVL